MWRERTVWIDNRRGRRALDSANIFQILSYNIENHNTDWIQSQYNRIIAADLFLNYRRVNRAIARAETCDSYDLVAWSQ